MKFDTMSATIELQWQNLMNTRAGETENRVRSTFDRDYDRIIFSKPFRRLQDKTQVFPLPEDEFVHNRLTHSLEVASVARSLGREVGAALLLKYPSLTGHLQASDFGAVTAAAALCHDIGNPPFGHSGEAAISDFFKHNPLGQEFRGHLNEGEWSDLTNFEGNAQGFRLLVNEENQGLILSFPTLAAFAKYPRASDAASISGRKSQKKYGFFQTEKERFQSIAKALSLPTYQHAWCRHPLVFLVEAADDICYQIMDLEDGYTLGLIGFEECRDLLADILKEDYRPGKLNHYPLKQDQIGVLRAMAIGRLVRECVSAFLSHEEAIIQGEFDQALTDSIASAAELKAISEISVQRIYQSKLAMEREVAGFEVINGLLSRYCLAMFHTLFVPERKTAQDKVSFRMLPEEYRLKLKDEKDLYRALRVIIDMVSGMTDREALTKYRVLSGIPMR
jgi:dGTPase